MKAWSVFRKSVREQMREPLSLILVLVSAPAFVLVYWLLFGGAGSTYTVLVLNQDTGIRLSSGSLILHSNDMMSAIQSLSSESGQPLLRLQPVAGRVEANNLLSNHKAAMLLVIPPDFSATLENWSIDRQPGSSPIIISGDLGYPPYVIAAGVVSALADQFVQAFTQESRPFQFVEEALGASMGRSDFEIYVPGLLVVAIALLIFQSSMAVAREVEAGTLRRLQMTRVSSLDLLAGISATQILIGLVSVLLTFLTALVLGFRSTGSILLAFIFCALTTLSVIGCGLVVACFARSVSQAFVIANFPLIALMFFSGAAFPVGEVPLFSIAGRTVNLFDILPPTHTVIALNKIMGLGAGIRDVAYELTALVALSLLYFILGVVLFHKMHLRPR